ncbi:hypothetical protein EST38_g351 [Candolleomyces aberdarensis]|uniref:Uncharacterized protein n=1 Tax=Candolleomyces aberdarensis TaxID=2316362 RepID=A0A4V1Q5H0_9AGAR|nr:hypothetical protein EST38_g351 [Candolleomyces aberdarensis]
MAAVYEIEPEDWECEPACDPPEDQHERLFSLRDSTAQGIPCILWGEDALHFAHGVPVSSYLQTILVPDDVLEEAATILLIKGSYVPGTPSDIRRYCDYIGHHTGVPCFPKFTSDFTVHLGPAYRSRKFPAAPLITSCCFLGPTMA